MEDKIKELIDLAQPDNLCLECEQSECGVCYKHLTERIDKLKQEEKQKCKKNA